MQRASLSLAVLLSALTTACGVETVVQDLNEREANQIIETLANTGINADKTRNQEGRNVTYAVTVPSSARIESYRILNENELPRRRDAGYTTVFEGSGLIPSASEERAKALAALEGEIEAQLKLVHGMLDARVQIVLPEPGQLQAAGEVRPEPSASVAVKYLPDGQGRSPLGERQIATLVAKGVEKLQPENVYVVLTPAVPSGLTTSVPGLDAKGPLGNMNRRQVNMMIVAVCGLILVLCIAIVFSQIRLRTVRGRLLRLQNEIAKARRKPNEGAPSNAA